VYYTGGPLNLLDREVDHRENLVLKKWGTVGKWDLGSINWHLLPCLPLGLYGTNFIYLLIYHSVWYSIRVLNLA